MSDEESARAVEKIRQGDNDDTRTFADALVKGARMLCRIVEERGVEEALGEAQEAVKVAKKVLEDEEEHLEDDRALRARVYKVIGIVEALTAAKGWFYLGFALGDSDLLVCRAGSNDSSDAAIRRASKLDHFLHSRPYECGYVLSPSIRSSRSASNIRCSTQRATSRRTRATGRTRVASPGSTPHSDGRLGWCKGRN